MNRTIKDATVKRYHYDTHDQLRVHLQLFVDASNHARRLKTLRGLTPYEFVFQIWTKEPDRFRLDPSHHIPGPYTSASNIYKQYLRKCVSREWEAECPVQTQAHQRTMQRLRTQLSAAPGAQPKTGVDAMRLSTLGPFYPASQAPGNGGGALLICASV